MLVFREIKCHPEGFCNGNARISRMQLFSKTSPLAVPFVYGSLSNAPSFWMQRSLRVFWVSHPMFLVQPRPLQSLVYS